ncbi:MAG: leucine-rich repeat protein [Lachnospiraceae bacterium]|nr:leucine-rich repeat protein [Lachnospiraceae bacterium]
MRTKNMPIKKFLVGLLAISTAITAAAWPVSASHAHTAEAATKGSSCPFGGSATTIGYAGCSACGGTGRYYMDNAPAPDTNQTYGYSAGTGYNMRTETDAEGTWECYYRCYNCGDTGYDCKQYDELIYKKLIKSISTTPVGYTRYYNASKAPGKVPLRWCSSCGPVLKANGQAYETEATWAQWHLDPEPSLTPVPKYILTINYGEGGIAYGDNGEHPAGESVSAKASPNNGYRFRGWCGDTGGLGIDVSKAEISFQMSAENVTLTAEFEKVEAPEVSVTQKPVATPTPEPTKRPEASPTPTLSPVPTATPIPTPAPPYIPSEDKFRYKNHVRYYTTDAGYTMEEIYNNNGYLANLNGVEGNGQIGSCSYTLLDTNYFVGTDADGNTWYFSVSGTEAHYVHPNVYKGYHADTSEVRYIKELTFPSTLQYNGISYTVTSIGGGTERYSTKSSFASYGENQSISGEFGKTEGHYSYTKYYSYYNDSNDGSFYYHDENMSEQVRYIYGVIGNGCITSCASRYFQWSEPGIDRYEYEDYQNDYYVYNTTLEWLEIPDTVTTIESYAFYCCQALKKISGAQNVTSIGEYAFAGADHLEPLLCENGPQYSFRYYYYNGAYSFDAPTAVMLDWKENTVLSGYMELAEFPELKTVGSGAFMWHTNLFDVKLPVELSAIKGNAFAGCNLNSITIPGKSTEIEEGKDYSDKDGHEYKTGGGSTLGTKGTSDTVIYTVPESEAMFYGLKYIGYYTLRCGYEVTYRNNAEQEETYTSVSMLRTIWKTAVQSEGGYLINQGGHYIYGDVYYIDEDGGLWRKESLFSAQIAKGTKFKEFITMTAYHWNGGIYESCKRIFAVAESGDIWLCEGDGLNLNIPVGAHSFQWSGNGYEIWIYYLDADGHICCARIAESSDGCTLNVKHERILNNYPPDGAYRLESIVIENEGEPYPGAMRPVYYNGTEYLYGCPPQITARMADGRLLRYTGYPMSASYSPLSNCYMPPVVIVTDCGDFVWIYKTDKDVMGDGNLFSSSGYDTYYFDRSGNLCRAWYDGNEKRYKNERIAGGNFTETNNGIGSTFILLCEEGGIYILNQRNRKAELLFTGTAVEKTWTISGIYHDYDEYYGYSRTFYYDILYVLDDAGRLFCAYDLPEKNEYGKKMLVDGVKKVEIYKTNGNGMLVLDEGGDLWTVGTNSYGALPTDRAYYTDASGYEGVTLLWEAEKITSAVKYTDIYMDKNGYYSLVRDTAGDVYAAGYSRDVFGDYQNHIVYIKVSVQMDAEFETEKKVFLAGYEFAETLYASMFTRDGYRFLYWNTKADESGTTYYPGETLLLTGPLEVYAQWERDCNKIRYAPNGGAGFMEDTVCALSVVTVKLSLNTYTKSGYRFTHWNTKADGSGTSYQDGEEITVPQGVTVLHAQWIENKEILLDGRGATKQEQKSFFAVYGEKSEEVIPPEKTGYTFAGYFTEIRGNGTKYFDENGIMLKEWTEKNTNVLYAYWIQNPIELPEEEKKEDPEVLPETDYIIEAASGRECVQIYADDYNPDTGAADDLPPYQVSDVYSGTELLTEGAIPSTECVAMRAQMGSYLFSAVLSRKSGTTQVRTYVTVHYKTVYEDAETEELITSEPKEAVIEVMVPKAWSYWELKEGGLYYPTYVTVSNEALKDESIKLLVEWDGYERKKPSYTYVSYDEHIVWNEYDTDGVPMRTLTVPEEYVIVSGTPGENPDVARYLTVIAENFAWADKKEFMVKNDRVRVGDVVVLSDTEQEKDSVPPADNITERLKENIPLTAYEQTYAFGIPLLKESKNQSYESSAFCIYEADVYVTGEQESKTKEAAVNAVNIHTPVVCEALLEAAHEDKYQCKEIPEGSTVLVLSETGIHSDFTVQILNEGYHSDRKGYGARSYTQYLAQKEGKPQNEVRFPFEVWVDSGNDNDSNNDVLLKEGTWYTLGTEKQRFYIPIWVTEGEYKIEMRSVAVNAKGDEEKAEAGRNTQKENYTATAEQSVYITGCLYDFTVYDIRGNAAWEEVREQELYYPVDTLPLRAGLHPYYKNVGGLPAGGSFSFRVKSIGNFYGEDAILTIVPELVLITKEGRKAVDVYYEKETAQGVFLKKWDGREHALKQYGGKQGNNAVQYWYGTFALPDMLYAAESGSDVLGYQKRYGLNFSEDFWIKGESLMLQFALRIENGKGEVLYYGKLPEYIKNDIWCQELRNRVCTDTHGRQYFIEGGDVAVIYSGESAAGDYSIHGIH